jgi:hypothetical protein
MIAAALDRLVAALEAAGLRVAVRAQDITPPVCLLHIGTVTDTGGPLEDATVVVFYVHYIPVRGVDNLAADAAGLDTLYGALTPISWGEMAANRTSVSVGSDVWPCYRIDVGLLAGQTVEV